jgi:hypothetical protein
LGGTSGLGSTICPMDIGLFGQFAVAGLHAKRLRDNRVMRPASQLPQESERAAPIWRPISPSSEL